MKHNYWNKIEETYENNWLTLNLVFILFHFVFPFKFFFSIFFPLYLPSSFSKTKHNRTKKGSRERENSKEVEEL